MVAKRPYGKCALTSWVPHPASEKQTHRIKNDNPIREGRTDKYKMPQDRIALGPI